MQSFEVSGAVRPLYGSLGVKGLIAMTHSKYALVPVPDFKTSGYRSNGGKAPYILYFDKG